MLMALLAFSIQAVDALASSHDEVLYGAESYFVHEDASVDNERRTFVEKYGTAFPVPCTCAPSHGLSELYYFSHQGTQLETTVRSKT